VLVTGATGYVGSRLIPSLLHHGHEVVATARETDRLEGYAWTDDVERRRLDVEDTVSVHLAVRDVDVVVYLVHSMGHGEFLQRDADAARSLAHACEYAGTGRVVYLSGLVPDVAESELSDHLRSRLEVEEILLEAATPATVLRASMVIGAGSTSFEIMRRVSERLPVTTLPTWMRSRIQPVSVEDVVAMLVAAVKADPGEGSVDRSFDVGGSAVLTYAQLLHLFAHLAGLPRPQVRVPLVPVLLVGEGVALLSGLPRSTVSALVRSLAHDMVCRDDDAATVLLPGHRYLGLDEAISRSLAGDTDATTYDGDVQGQAASDPEWVGSTR